MNTNVHDHLAAVTHIEPPRFDIERIERIRQSARSFLLTLDREGPDSPELTKAMHKVREAVYFGVQSVVLAVPRATGERPVVDAQGCVLGWEVPLFDTATE